MNGMGWRAFSVVVLGAVVSSVVLCGVHGDRSFGADAHANWIGSIKAFRDQFGKGLANAISDSIPPLKKELLVQVLEPVVHDGKTSSEQNSLFARWLLSGQKLAPAAVCLLRTETWAFYNIDNNPSGFDGADVRVETMAVDKIPVVTTLVDVGDSTNKPHALIAALIDAQNGEQHAYYMVRKPFDYAGHKWNVGASQIEKIDIARF